MAQSYKVVITEQAESSLEKIVEYLLYNVSYEAADKVRKGVLESIYSLAKDPDSNAPANDLNEEKIVYRRIWKWSYRIVFRVVEKELEVLVVQVHHANENPDKIRKSLGIE